MSYLRNATIMMKNPPKNCNPKQQIKYLPQKLYLWITKFLVFQTCDLGFNTTGFQNFSLSPTNVLIIIVQKQLKFEFVELYVPLETDHVV